MAKYISNWSGSYPNSAVSNTATDITSMVSNARDWYNYLTDADTDPAGIYEDTPTYISGYLYDGSDFAIYGSGFFTNTATITKLEFTTNGWMYAYAGNVSLNTTTYAQSGALNHVAIGSPTGEQVDFYGNFNVNSTATIGTITKITYQDADETFVLKGALSYNYLYGTMTGNITSYQFTDPLGHSYTLSNFSIPFSQLNAYSDLNSFVADIMAGDDNIVGTAASEVILGYAGNDTLDGGAGADTLAAGTGNDTYIVDNIGDIVTESSDEGTDLVKVKITTANGTFALGDNVENATLINTVAYNLTGNDENNILIGNAANNIIDAGLGNDRLDGGLGNDTLVGGAGDDLYFVNVATDTVSELGGEGTDTVKSAVTYSLIDTDGAGSNGGNVENLELTGASAINATGNNLQNILTGNAAANILDGKAGADTMIGGKGADTYIVDDLGDTVTEDFTLALLGGVDLVKSSVDFTLGDNVDNLTLGTVTSTEVIDGTGNDINNIIIGNAGNNTLTGNAGIDTLTGNDGNDTLDGGLGNDTMNGGKGDDLYIVDSITDVVTESLTFALGGGIDTVQSSVTRTLGANFDNLTLTGVAINGTGNALGNVIFGNAGNNVLKGLGGNDTINGGTGNDILVGGLGNDLLRGGDGSDIFRFESTLNASTNLDTITDFISGDDLQLENSIFMKLTITGALSGDNFRSAAGVTAQDANDYILYDTTNGALYYDADGNGAGAAIHFATLVGSPSINASDIWIT